MSWRTINTIAAFTLQTLRIVKAEGAQSSPEVKHLPVLRPSQSSKFIISPK